MVVACGAAAWPEASPLYPDNAGRPAGDERWAWLFLACEVAAFGAYALGLLALSRGASALPPIAAVAVAIQVVPLAAPLLLSTDAWTYWDYGRIAAVHGGNPYSDPPIEYSQDPAYAYVGEAWRETTSVYGPAFTLASEPLARATGSSADAAAWLYKALAAAAMLLATALAARLSRRKALACAFVGWNPLLALHFAGGGHNDAWIAALVMAALALGSSGRRELAGAAWAASVLVKWVPLVFLPLSLLEARATGRRLGYAGFALAAGAIVALAAWRYGDRWLGAFGPLARNANSETTYSLPHRLEGLGVPDWLALAGALAGFAVVYVWLLRQALAGRARLGLAAGVLLLATPYLAPWYVAWAAPLAAAEDDRVAQWLTLAVCAYLLPQTVPL